MTAATDLRHDEILSRTERSRVVRRFMPGGSIICKEALGPGAEDRTRHEVAMLERLAFVSGIAKLSAAMHGNDAARNSFSLVDEPGETLAAVLSRERLDVATLLDLARQLAETLVAVHALRIVHRDINPSNILLVGAERRAVLIDFHIASSFAEERPAFTAQAGIAGTLAYIAPEQTGRTGRVVDHRADLYALGATLYEMAVGHTPFDGGDSFQLICDHLVRVAATPASLDPALPQTLSDIIMRLLEKEPDQRYQSAEGLASDVTRLAERYAAGEGGSFALGLRDFPKRLLPPSRLIGREVEIATLAAAFTDAVAGRRNGLLIAGVPGVGKTALVDELRPIVTAERGWFVSAKFDQFHNDVANDAVSCNFRRLLNLLLAEPEEELAPIRTRLVEALGRNAGLAAALLPELALLLGIAPDAAIPDSANAQARLAQIGFELLSCIASSARPVVFILDDLQWAYATPLGFFDAMLGEQVPGLLLVGIYRATEVDSTHPLSALLSRWARFAAPPRKLLVQNLRADDLGTLLASMLRITPERAAGLASAVGDRTEGNPYDTVELINALRHDGALVFRADGWTWEATTIRRYVGHGDVVDLLTARIDALPPATRVLLETIACLGGDVAADVLQTAAEYGVVELEAHLAPALDDGLIVLDRAAGQAVRFRHDRVQQAAYGGLDASKKLDLHRTIARRLACAAYHGLAAEQYFAALDGLRDAQECVTVVALFREAAVRAAMLANYAASERYLGAALRLREYIPSGSAALTALLENELHAALYNLGRLERADELYASIALRGGAALDVVDTTCIQINSLTNRNMPTEALVLGLDLLERLGFVAPDRRHIAHANAVRLDSLERWCDGDASRELDLERAEATDAVARGAARLLDCMMPPAFFCDHDILNWLVLEGVRLWGEYGPQAALVGPLSHISNVTIAIRDDYRGAYVAARRILSVSEARGYEPETSHSRFLFALVAEHWFEPPEDAVLSAHMAHVGLLHGGDLQNACFTYFASIALLVQCSETVQELAQEAEAGLTSGIRTGNGHAEHVFLPFRQLAKALRGETAGGASFSDHSFDEDSHLASLGQNPTAAAYFHITRALAALVFGATTELVSNASAALALLQHIETTPLTALAHQLYALAAAARYRGASGDERRTILETLDASRAWLQRRADDAPANFLHAVRLVEAERDWALGDVEAASGAFEAALREARFLRSPRHRALISERAGLFNLERGLERYGLLLLDDARQSYQAWGATAKVARLAGQYPSSSIDRIDRIDPGSTAVSTTVSSETIDMVGILRASQALSSQTTLESLKASVVELLAALTGATSVLLVVRGNDSEDWFLSGAQKAGAAPVAVNEAGALGLLPLTVFRYVDRTREPLLLTDAVRDDRFARDPYFARYEVCSMLVVPISSQAVPRAVLILENRLGRAAFSTDRLDTVMLIAGQLAVSLDNALLYASLERKVAERTEALATANERLALLSRTDPLTGLANRRAFDERLAAECSRAQRSAIPIGLAMIDIDHFKSYNDRFGHPAGDSCLKHVADTLQSELRPGSDLVARYGGEEFIVLLPGADMEGADAAAERLRSAVAEISDGLLACSVTVSVGLVAFVPKQGDTATRYIELADVALYEAKRTGRNRVMRAEPHIVSV